MKLMSPTQIAKALNISEETVKRRLREKKWPFYRVGDKSLRIDLDEILSLVKEKSHARSRR